MNLTTLPSNVCCFQEQACATCLILATSTSGGGSSVYQSVAQHATKAFFQYGGEPEYNYNVAPPTNIGPTLGKFSICKYILHQIG